MANQRAGTHVKGTIRLPREYSTQTEELPEFWNYLHRTTASLTIKVTQGTIWIVEAEQAFQASYLVYTLGYETASLLCRQVEQRAIQ